MDTGLPYNPLRSDLYAAEELYGAYRLDDVESYARCNDVSIFQRFKSQGIHPVGSNSEGVLQALHDNTISRLVADFVGARRVAAIMGGHAMERGSGEYADVVHMARSLSRAGTLVASGGGPGAMEAAHLGAYLQDASDGEVKAALAELSAFKAIPSDAANLVMADGSIDYQVSGKLHAYLAPAMRIRARHCAGGISLAIPTWLYGHEPSTPFASHIAKYFQNSIREDGLVTLGISGIVFTEGKAGTIQEIFQDAAQNYYASTPELFRKMVFLSGPGRAWWEEKYPVKPLVEALLGSKPYAMGKILFTEDVEQAIGFLTV
jgi:hypothetical protein